MAFEAYYRPPGSFVMAGPRPTAGSKQQKPGQPGQPTFTLGGTVGGSPGSGMPPVYTTWPGPDQSGGGSGMPPVTTSWPGPDGTYPTNEYPDDWETYGIG